MKGRHRLIVLSCAAAFVAFVLTALFWPRSDSLYKVTVLPALCGERIFPQAINDHGQVVGWANRLGIAGCRLFLWDQAKGIGDLGPIAPRRLDINNKGQIVGTMFDPNGVERAIMREPDGTVRFLGTLGGTFSNAWAINNRGEVVGVSETSKGFRHAFLWNRRNGMRDLGTLGGSESKAYAINDSGSVFGSSETGRGLSPSFIWDPNHGMVKAGPSHPSTHLGGVNRGSWLAGDTYLGGEHCMVLWHPDRGVQKLFPLGQELADASNRFSDRVFLNDANQVAFSLYDEAAFWKVRQRIGGVRLRCFLWDPEHGRVSLDGHIPAGSLKSFWLQDLNNKGCILGGLASKNWGYCRAVLLEPIPKRWGP